MPTVYCGNGSLSDAAALYVSSSSGRVGALYRGVRFSWIAAVSVRTGSVRALPIDASYGRPLAWSQDGLWVASHPAEGVNAKAPLLIANTQTGIVRALLDADAAANISGLAWSPDNRQLLVTRSIPASGSQPAQDHLQLIDVQTGQLVRDLGPGGGGVFSPNGREIAFQASDGRLVLLDLASGQQTPLAVFNANGVSWSPDGKAIAFSVQGSPPQLWVIHLKTGFEHVVGTNIASGFTWFGKSLVWSTGSGVTVSDTTPLTENARTIYPLPPWFATKTTEPLQTLPVGILPGQRVVYDLQGGGYRTVSITGRNDAPLLPCRGKGYDDKVIGSQLNDQIDVRNGTLDTVDCKAGNDFVRADRIDHIARNCETVVRR